MCLTQCFGEGEGRGEGDWVTLFTTRYVPNRNYEAPLFWGARMTMGVSISTRKSIVTRAPAGRPVHALSALVYAGRFSNAVSKRRQISNF